MKGFRWVDDTLFLKPADGSNPTTMRQIAKEKYLGFIWNGENKTVRLPEEKILLRIDQIKEYAHEKKQSFKNTEVLVGRLNHITFVIPDEVREDLEIWLKTLTEANPIRIIPKPETRNVGWVGDASTSFGIGVIIGRKWSQFKLKDGWRSPEPNGDRQGIAWAEKIIQ